MNLDHKDRFQNLGHAKQTTEKREDYLACILELWEKKGYARVVDIASSFSSRSKRDDQAFSQHRLSQARKVPRIYADREWPGHGVRNPRQASDTNGLSSIAWPARECHSTRRSWPGTPSQQANV